MLRFINTSKVPQLRGSKMISPDDSRVIGKADVLPSDVVQDYQVFPASPEGTGEAPDDTAIDLEAILAGNVGEVKAALLGLSSQDLDDLETLEELRGKRQGVLGAIAQLRVGRAAIAQALQDDLINGLSDQADDVLAELATMHADNDSVAVAIAAEQNKRATAG